MKEVFNQTPLPFFNGLMAICMAFFLLAPVCQAEPPPEESYHCITRFKNGSINWTTGMITAIGKASPEDNTEFSQESVPGSAWADASRQIINILKQIKIHPALTVEEYASKNDIILAGIEKTARDATITRQYYTSGLSVEIMLNTSMLGGFLQLVLPERIRQIPKINPEIPIKSRENPDRTHYTGLIIDARGLGVEPVLNPVIVSEQGNNIYSDEFISREFAVKNGVCKYICTLEDALNHRRLGNYPLVFKALRKEGKENSAIVISMSDYLLLETIAERHTFLKECRVIIVKGQ